MFLYTQKSLQYFWGDGWSPFGRPARGYSRVTFGRWALNLTHALKHRCQIQDFEGHVFPCFPSQLHLTCMNAWLIGFYIIWKLIDSMDQVCWADKQEKPAEHWVMRDEDLCSKQSKTRYSTFNLTDSVLLFFVRKKHFYRLLNFFPLWNK